MAQRLLSARRLCSSAAPRRKRAFRRWALALDASADAFAVEHDAAAASAGLPWRIVAATCVERTPTIMRDAEQWEDAWWNVEDELSAPDPGAPEGFWVKQSECVSYPTPPPLSLSPETDSHVLTHHSFYPPRPFRAQV